ncbi:hypothetical protein FRC10_010279 [Ceratobasidium sp. 414]|nr:hypothetical protein FRC10_010279 [Ceratobasidium sp. 414]
MAVVWLLKQRLCNILPTNMCDRITPGLPYLSGETATKSPVVANPSYVLVGIELSL